MWPKNSASSFLSSWPSALIPRQWHFPEKHLTLTEALDFPDHLEIILDVNQVSLSAGMTFRISVLLFQTPPQPFPNAFLYGFPAWPSWCGKLISYYKEITVVPEQKDKLLCANMFSFYFLLFITIDKCPVASSLGTWLWGLSGYLFSIICSYHDVHLTPDEVVLDWNLKTNSQIILFLFSN